MRKTTIFNYDNVDMREIVRDEIKNAKLDKVTEKMDKLYELMDKIAGELKDFREEQTLHQGQHDDITEELEKHDKKLRDLERPTL